MSLREIVLDWLTSSRYIQHLEATRIEQRQDFLDRIAEKDAQIKALRIELAEIKQDNDRMKLVLMPLGSAAGRVFADKFQEPRREAPKVVPLQMLDWQGELSKMINEDGNGRIGTNPDED